MKDKKPEPQWVTRQQFLEELIKEVKKMSPEEKAEPRGPTWSPPEKLKPWSPPQSTYTFSLIRNPGDEPEMIDIKAANRFTAREKFNKQVGDYHRRRNRQGNPTRV